MEPKHAVVEYGRTYRPNIKFVEAGAENIPLPCEHFDKVVVHYEVVWISKNGYGLGNRAERGVGSGTGVRVGIGDR